MAKEFPKHPDYKKLFDLWEFYLYSYEAGREYIQKGGEDYLYRHPREQKDDYRFRTNRAVFESISQVILNVYQSHIRRKGIQRNENEKQDYLNFYENCDFEGHDLNYYMLERVFIPTQVFGWCGVMADLPENGEELKSEYDRKEKEIRPYLITYFPTEIVNWQWNKGKFDWIVLKESNYENIENPRDLKKSQDEIINYKIWTKDSWIKVDKNNKPLTDEVLHKWGQIPISVFHNRESLIYDLPIGLSALQTIAELDRKCLNLSSLLDEFLYRQCFAQIVMDKDMLGKIIETGTTRVLLSDPEAKDPFFLEPPTGAGQFIVSERDRTIESAYRHALIRGDNYVQEKTEQSGVAKAYDLHDSNQNIAQKSRNMESGENRLHKFLEKFHGEITAEYPTEFDIKTLNEELAESLEFFKADFGSVSYNRHRAMKLIERDLQDADPKLLKTIHDEIQDVNPGLSFEQRNTLWQEALFDTVKFMQSIDPEMKTMKPEDVKAKFRENVEMKQQKSGVKPEPTLKELIE